MWFLKKLMMYSLKGRIIISCTSFFLLGFIPFFMLFLFLNSPIYIVYSLLYGFLGIILGIIFSLVLKNKVVYFLVLLYILISLYLIIRNILSLAITLLFSGGIAG